MPTSVRWEVTDSPQIPVKSGAACGRTESSAPYRMRWTYSVRISELPQASREKSRKTKGVFLVASRGLRGEIEIPRARFLIATFAFGEAKEKAVPQLLLSNIGSYIDNCIVDHCGKISR